MTMRIASLALIATASGGLAQVDLLEQTRTLRAGTLEASAPAFGPFDETLEQIGDDCGGLCVPPGAVASQTSVVSADLLTAEVDVAASGGSVAATSAESTYNVSFRVSGPTTLSIEGSARGAVGGFDPPGFTIASANIQIIRVDDATLAEWTANGFSGTIDIGPEAFELEPGIYRVLASATASGPEQDGGSAEFDFVVTLAGKSCPADLTGDGLADLDDLQAFIDAFTAGELAADFNGDGLYDLADIQIFVTAFNAGCP